MSARTSKLSVEARELVPLHVAVIMDGNGRWALKHGLPRVEGHRRGAESARAVINAAAEAGVRYLTLYTFSMENWNRPKTEVDAIMRYLAHYLKKEVGELNRNNVRLEAIGQIHRLPKAVQRQLEKTRAALAKKNTRSTRRIRVARSCSSAATRAPARRPCAPPASAPIRC